MKILVAPLNWGLGHASRCVPLVQRLLDEGNEVILGGDGESLTLLRKHFPKLRYTYLAPLNLQYSAGRRQVWAMMKALPRIVLWSIKDHVMLKALLRKEPIDRVISDNRFGLYNRQAECIYITHQMHIMLPKGWRWAEKIASRIHARVYTRYNKVWVPDYEDPQKSLAGALSHPGAQVEYIGPLSRFEKTQNTPINPNTPNYSVVAVLSGLEPHRTLLEKEILARYQDSDGQVLIVQGLLNRPNTRIKRGNVTLVPTMGDADLAMMLKGAKHIIARSGYSTIMDLEALGLFGKAELIPTPGQPEQEYLAAYLAEK
jgi:uncharacterized protein (TIGR00661 family)